MTVRDAAPNLAAIQHYTSMLKDDDFVVIVPVNGAPFLAMPGADLSPYVSQPFTRLGKMVALKDGRSVSGSVFRGRETDAGDEIQIMDLLNRLFVRSPNVDPSTPS